VHASPCGFVYSRHSNTAGILRGPAEENLSRRGALGLCNLVDDGVERTARRAEHAVQRAVSLNLDVVLLAELEQTLDVGRVGDIRVELDLHIYVSMTQGRTCF
jgi:hypothetical protein